LKKYVLVGILATVALVSAFVYFAFVMFEARLYHSRLEAIYQDLLDGDLLFKMNSEDMEPTINLDDVMVIKNITNINEVNVGTYGDIIVFYQPKVTANSSDLLIFHRAINKVTVSEVAYFRTKGDASTASDFWPSDYRGELYSWQGMISEKLLIGKVIDIVPSGVSFVDSVPYPPSG